MASFTPPQRRPRSAVEGNSSDSEDDNGPAANLKGAKRAKLTNGDDDDNSEAEQQEEEEDEEDDGTQPNGGGADDVGSVSASDDEPAPKTAGVNGVNGTSHVQHRPGAIVRVKLRDFVTYRSAEFFPGPRLNMVIGPNGTGKSTLVCAICLGLGWGPQHLGRAKEPAEFIKHGCREAKIEIELAGIPGKKRNYVTSRTIRRDGSKNTFTINGQVVSGKKVQELARSFAIQIDNLCQFLPQDKVSEFAAMTPVELLRSTQRAAAPPQMLVWHEELTELRKRQKDLQLEHSGSAKMYADLERRQDMQREDVERMRQRAQIKKRVEMLETARPVPRYKELHEKSTQAKERRNALREEERVLNSQLEPALRSANQKGEYANRIKLVLEHKRNDMARIQNAVKAASQEIGAIEDQIQDAENEIEGEKAAGKKHRDTLQAFMQKVNHFKRLQETEPPEFDSAAFNERIRDLNRQQRNAEEKRREVQSNTEALKTQLRDKDTEIVRLERRLQNLQSQTGQQEEKLRRWSRDTYEAWQAIKDNQHHFDQKIYGPPLVECSIKNARYADAIESILGRSDFLTFTAQSHSDFRRLQGFLRNRRLHDVTLRTVTQSLSSVRNPIDRDQLRELGFDCWAADLLSGPEPVLALLIIERGLQRTPIGLQEMSEDELRRMGNHPFINSWVSGRKSYRVNRRSEYGPDAVSTRVQPLGAARNWTNQIDSSATESIVRDSTMKKAEKAEIEEEIQGVVERYKSVTYEARDFDSQKKQLEKEKQEIQSNVMNYRSLPDKIEQCDEKIRQATEGLHGIRDKVEEIRVKQDDLILQKAEAALAFANTVHRVREAVEDIIGVEIQYHEATSDQQTLRERNQHIHDTLSEKRQEVEEATARFSAINRECKVAYNEFNHFAQTLAADEELSALVEHIRDWTVAQLEAEIESERSRLDMIFEGHSSIIGEFERRQAQIERLQTKMTETQQALDDVNAAIRETRSKWEPALDALVEKISSAFSDSFQRIGCAGQVSIDKADRDAPSNGEPNNDRAAGAGNEAGAAENDAGSDFGQWAIQIQVKFRASESLQILNAHRQSGGERAVSTIFYLMALQSLSKSPFRVVDEINQGMDPRNERMVHGRMVDIACNEADGSGGQYFLITPKLLSGLLFRPGMKVLCIVSGQYVPDNNNALDFRRCIDAMTSVRQGEEGAAALT